jgi:hypothetical protein
VNNAQTYVFISIASVLFVGSWSLFLAVELDKAKAEIRRQKAQIAKMVEPPF